MSIQADKIIAVRTSKTVYRDGDRVIKVFDEDYSKADVLNEALNQARVEETGLHIPKILEVLKMDGKWAIVSEYIPGVTLQQLMIEHPEKIDFVLEMFVKLQMEVHSKEAPLLHRLKEKMTRKINEATIDSNIRNELLTRLEAMPRHKKVCHGDFCPSNIILSEEGTLYVIDWAHATQGNASADVARTYLLFRLEGEIETAGKYLKLFCQLSGTALPYVQKWLSIVAASQSVKGRAEEREFLMNWVNLVDYE